jgi:hypothetical protein
MSIAGVLASTLFSGLGAQVAQKALNSSSSSGLKSDHDSGDPSDASSSFAANLSAQGSRVASGSASLTAQVTKLGQDLSSAGTDSSNISAILAPAKVFHQPAKVSSTDSQSNLSNASLTAALQAYSSLQQNPVNSAMSGSLLAGNSTFAVSA